MRKLAVALTVSLAGVGLVACGGAGSSGGAGVFTTVDETHTITAGAPMNPYNPDGNSFDGYDQIELGYSENSSTDPNASFPAIAEKWQATPAGLVVRLQPRAGWSDGSPVTSVDIKASVAAAFTQGTQPTNLSGVTVLGPKEIRFDPIPGSTNQLFTADVLGTIVVPASEYDSRMPADIWTTIAASEQTEDGRPTVAAARAQTALTTIGKKLADFAPKTDIAAGPFVLERLNPGEGLLVRNPHFYAASSISPKEVVLRNYTGNEQIWSYLESGELDAAPYTSMPTNVLDEILRTHGNQEVASPSYTGAALGFDEHDYPYGILAVRQALAYVLDRPAITEVGEGVSGTAAATQTGMIDSVVPDWLTPVQRSALNPYAYDPAKAVALLTHAGFSEKSGRWIMPDGRPWKLTIESVTGFSDWIAAANYMASRLTSFGIPADNAIASDYATYLANVTAGEYAVGFWLNALGPSISSAYSRVWGANISAVGDTELHPTGGNWLHTPSTYMLPHYGIVHPDALTEKLPDLTTREAKPVVAELAAAYDREVPMITLWNYTLVQFVNTTRWTDFPAGGPILDQPPGLWMWRGYVHAR